MAASKDYERRKWNFPYRLDVQTRWLDNDQYGHLNNSSYFLITDSISNTYLIDHCGLQPYQHPDANATLATGSASASSSAAAIGLVISSSASFFAPTSFPNALCVGLRVIQLGSSSVTYEVGIFEVPPPTSGASQRVSSSLSSSQSSPSVALPSDALAAVITRVTHVFVDRTTRRPLKPMPTELHEGLAKLKVDQFMLQKDADSEAKKTSKL